MTKNTIIICLIIAAGLLWRVSYGLGYRAGTDDTGNAAADACVIALEATQNRERQICRWTAKGCHGTADCGDMERGRLAGWQYSPIDGDWIMDWEAVDGNMDL